MHLPTLPRNDASCLYVFHVSYCLVELSLAAHLPSVAFRCRLLYLHSPYPFHPHSLHEHLKVRIFAACSIAINKNRTIQMELWLGAAVLGLCYGFLAIGVYITMRIYNFPDITADGSLTLGASITAVLLVIGVSPVFATFVAMLFGFLAGSTTGVIHTKLKVNGLLSGILVTTALYSINLRIMGRSNIPLLTVQTLLTPFENAFPDLPRWAVDFAIFFVISTVALVLLGLLFKTDFGLAMRATGDNEVMIAAQGVNTDTMKIIGIGLSNAMIALSGSLVCQYQGFADISMGIGIIVFGLASVIIGESFLGIFRQRFSVGVQLVSVVFGAIVFRVLVGVALSLGLAPTDFKIVTAFFVLLAVALPQLRSLIFKR